MKIHTMVVGTSKSKNENGYYISSKKKFWGSLYSAGLTDRLLEPEEFRSLTAQYGIGFAELAFDHIYLGENEEDVPIANDADLKHQLHVLNDGIPRLLEHLIKIRPARVVFNGKIAASAFLQFAENGKVYNLKYSHINQTGLSYGKIGSWKNIELFMLPNLSNAANRTWIAENGDNLWTDFWKSIKQVKPKRNKFLLAGFLILLIIILLFIFLNNT